MKNRIIPAFLALGVMMTASAAEVKVADGTKNVSVTEQVEAGKEATLIVVKADKSITSNDDVYALVTATSGTDGKVTWNFAMEEKRGGVLTDGDYDLYIKVPGKTFKKDTMTYSSLESRNALLSSLQGVTSSDTLETVVTSADKQTALKAAGFDTEGFSKLCTQNSAYQTEIIQNAYASVNDFASASVEDTATALNKAFAATGIRVDGENSEKYLSLANPSFENKSYSSLSDTQKTWMAGQISGADINSVSGLEDAYALSNMLYNINNSRVSDIKSVLGGYADALGISNSTEYLAYTNLSSKSAADEKIVDVLGDSPAFSVAELKSAISQGVSAGGESNANKNNSSYGGGGGGGGGASGTGTSASVVGSPIMAGAQTVASGTFDDLSNVEWAKEAIEKMAEQNIVAGDGSGKFNPDNTVTREEFVKMLVAAAKVYSSEAKCTFADCPEDAWFYPYVASAYKNGIAEGMSEEHFGVGEKLTRQDMAVLCKRAKKGSLAAVKEAETFTDDAQIADYAKDIIYELFSAGMINGMGDGSFAPLETATRAQAAVMIYNMFIK